MVWRNLKSVLGAPSSPTIYPPDTPSTDGSALISLEMVGQASSRRSLCSLVTCRMMIVMYGILREVEWVNSNFLGTENLKLVGVLRWICWIDWLTEWVELLKWDRNASVSDNSSINTHSSVHLRPLHDFGKLYLPGQLEYEFGFRTLSFLGARFRGRAWQCARPRSGDYFETSASRIRVLPPVSLIRGSRSGKLLQFRVVMKKLNSSRLERYRLSWSWNHVQATVLSKPAASDLRDSLTIWYVFQQNSCKIVSSNDWSKLLMFFTRLKKIKLPCLSHS